MLLHVENLEASDCISKKIVQNVSFYLAQGEMIALTGPSGSGKSITAQAIVGLLEKELRVTNGAVYYMKQNIFDKSEKELQKLRREDIAFMIQHSLNALDPIRKVQNQMLETIRQIQRKPKKELLLQLEELLRKVGFDSPCEILQSYPFELSGGMRQRVLIAMMLSLRPKILIADEPTTALDIVNRERIWTLFKSLQNTMGMTILIISHDDFSVKKYADRILYMREGGILI